MKIQYPPFIYFLPVGRPHKDVRAAIQLLREAYEVTQEGLAPIIPGFIYRTATPVSELDMEVIGLVPWE